MTGDILMKRESAIIKLSGSAHHAKQLVKIIQVGMKAGHIMDVLVSGCDLERVI